MHDVCDFCRWWMSWSKNVKNTRVNLTRKNRIHLFLATRSYLRAPVFLGFVLHGDWLFHWELRTHLAKDGMTTGLANAWETACLRRRKSSENNRREEPNICYRDKWGMLDYLHSCKLDHEVSIGIWKIAGVSQSLGMNIVSSTSKEDMTNYSVHKIKPRRPVHSLLSSRNPAAAKLQLFACQKGDRRAKEDGNLTPPDILFWYWLSFRLRLLFVLVYSSSCLRNTTIRVVLV